MPAIEIGDFFTLSNSVENINESDYSEIGLTIKAAKAFERSTYQCVYIIDYHKKDFLYVSNNITRLCGEDAKKIKDIGYKFYIDYVPEEDLEYTISYDFHIKKGNRRRLVNHKLTPIALTKAGKIWLAICTISLATGNKSGNVFIKKNGSDSFYEYSLYTRKWELKAEITLSDKEREVLSLSTQGYTMNDIADNLCKSIDTIKACKRNLFQKLNVKNITEALTYAQNHQLI